MRMQNDWRSPRIWLLAGSALLASCASASADRILLKGTGELKGVVVPDPAGREGLVGVLTERTVTPLPLKKAQIAKVIEEAGPLRDYLARKDKAEATGQAQYDLGLWCEQHKLPGPAEIQFRKAVEVDPTFAPARQRLGHVQVGDEWLTPDEAKQAKGLVRVKGKWITPDEKERRDAEEAAGAEQTAWFRQIQVIRQNLKSPKPDVRRLAQEQLADIKEPAAVGALVKSLGREIDELRVALLRALDGIEGPESSAALVAQYLLDPEPAVRAIALEIVTRRPPAEVHPKLIRALKSDKPEAIGRAALALAEGKVQTAVSNLIGALVQTRDRVELVPVEVRSGGGPSFVSGTNYTYAAQAIPVTAPGAVAYNVVPSNVLSGVALGGGPTSRIEPQYRVFRDFLPNREVREALVRLTGQDFGFDADSWRQWLATAKRAVGPDRRVPQP